jgi:glucose/mannose-6-phosphate isomerase
MMNLDDMELFATLDPADMLGEIDGLPDQLEQAWSLGQRLPLGDISGFQRVVIAGMGGSAIAGDLLAAYVSQFAAVPVMVWRNYGVPAFVDGAGTLLIVSSHSGETEEVLSAFDAGLEVGAQMIALTTGGELAQRANQQGIPLWQFEHSGQPRAAVGHSFGLLLAAFTRMGLIPDPELDVESALLAMRAQQAHLSADIPVVQNPAKRMAGQLIDRWPTIIAPGFLAPVARRWRTQIAELAKAVASYEELPEADHNMLAGVLNPEALFDRTMVIFLQGSLGHAHNVARVEITRKVLMVEGFNTDVIQAQGDTRLAQQWTSLHFGDYTAYYLAIAYGEDPTPVEAIQDFKRQLREGRG